MGMHAYIYIYIYLNWAHYIGACRGTLSIGNCQELNIWMRLYIIIEFVDLFLGHIWIKSMFNSHKLKGGPSIYNKNMQN